MRNVPIKILVSGEHPKFQVVNDGEPHYYPSSNNILAALYNNTAPPRWIGDRAIVGTPEEIHLGQGHDYGTIEEIIFPPSDRWAKYVCLVMKSEWSAK